MKNMLIAFIVSTLMLSCVTSSEVYENSLKFSYTDDVSSEKIMLKYINVGTLPICLSSHNLPSKKGRLNSNGTNIWLEVADNKYYFKEDNLGYCINCHAKLLPGKEIIAYLNYKDFHLPNTLYGERKYLSLNPIAYKCGDGKGIVIAE